MISGVRGTLVDFTGDPFVLGDENCFRVEQDGLLVIEEGKIQNRGNYNQLIKSYPHLETVDYSGYYVMPGFIDAHVHYSQIGIIGSYGKHLLEWLETYVYKEEAKFKDLEYSRTAAIFFLEELIRNGTTTALVFASVHPQSVDVFFEEAYKRNMRMIAGKVMMSRYAPLELLDSPSISYEESKGLIKKWHGTGRLLYAVTPRFGITCPREQLDYAGRLLKEFPGVYLHTHLAETKDEIRLTHELFPDCGDYLEVYEKSNLVTNRSVFAHGIHLSDSELKRLSIAHSSIAFCPTSNLFLGSGLFNLEKAINSEHPVKIGIGTDVGAGTGLSMFGTLNEAYKVLALQDQKLSSVRGFYLLTLGGAKSLSLDNKLGNFENGKEADFVVLNPCATPILNFRNNSMDRKEIFDNIDGVIDRLFSLMCMGDDRVIESVFISGKLQYNKKPST